jgi:hypothetical protein
MCPGTGGEDTFLSSTSERCRSWHLTRSSFAFWWVYCKFMRELKTRNAQLFHGGCRGFIGPVPPPLSMSTSAVRQADQFALEYSMELPDCQKRRMLAAPRTRTSAALHRPAAGRTPDAHKRGPTSTGRRPHPGRAQARPYIDRPHPGRAQARPDRPIHPQRPFCLPGVVYSR